SSVDKYEIVVEWDFNGSTYYYSQWNAITAGGHTYVPRIQDISGIAAVYIDRTRADFPRLSITFDNLADDWSSLFPFHALNATADFEDSFIRVRIYDHVAASLSTNPIWSGFVGRPEFSGGDYSVKLDATFPLDAA